MKNLFYILILVTSCAPMQKVVPLVEELYIVDFSPYAERGFLMTPERYEGNYESIADIEYIIKPGAEYKAIDGQDGDGEGYKISQWVVTDTITLDDALAKVYEICVNMGADALVNYHGEKLTDTRVSSLYGPVTITGYRITGYAIRRKED